MRLSQLEENMIDSELVEGLIYDGFDYDGSCADLILTLGSRKACEYRVPVAAKLFLDKKADMLLFSGGKAQDSRFGFMPEYRSMLLAADKIGLPTDRILCETRSMNTIENFEFSEQLISHRLPKCKNIILVTSAYHMRRALMLAENMLPQYRFIPCPAQAGSAAKHNWRLSEKGINTAKGEVMKLKYYAENGYIEDIII